MSLLPLMMRSLRPASMIEHHLRSMRQMEAIMNSAFPTYHIEWKEPVEPFRVKLDVRNFSPKEITVKTIDDSIIVEGKHEEESKEKGVIKRHFVKTYSLPIGYEPEDVVSSLSADGILTITAPTKTIEEVKNEREVPIEVEEQGKPKN